MYIRDLPPEILFRLYSMLDVPGQRNWQQLAVQAGFKTTDVQSFRKAEYCRGSPTEELLNVWGYKNTTVTRLYEALANMRHGQAMKLLKPYVDPKLHYMIREIEGEPLDNGVPSGQWPQAPLNNAGVNQPFMPSAQHTGPGPLMTPDKSMHGPPSYPQSPGRYAPQQSHQPPDFGNVYPPSMQHGQMNMGPQMSPSHLQPRLNYSVDTYGQPPVSHFLPRPNDIAVKKQMQNEKAAMTATIHKSYADIQRATNNFDEKNKLGEGSFGKVYLAVIGQTNYAVKVLLQNEHVQVAVHNSHRADQQKELAALVSYKHPNIVLMCFFSVDGEHPCIIYEYLVNGSLEDNLLCKKGKKPLSWKMRQHIAEGSALGINHLHTASSISPLIHGDIKSANILLDKHFEPKLGDFGLARPGPLNGDTHTILKTQFAHGTLPYLPEEFKRNLVLSTKVDSFSFGVVLMEILTGEQAYDERRTPHRLLSDKVKEGTEEDMEGAVAQLKDKKCPEWPDELFKEMLLLANKLTSKFKGQRPEMGEILLELRRMHARFGLSTVPETEQAYATQNSDPLPDSTTDRGDESKKPDPEGSKLSEEDEKQKSINEFQRKTESMIKNMGQGGPMGQNGHLGRAEHMGQAVQMGQGGPMGQDGHLGQAEHMGQAVQMGQGEHIGQVGPMGQGGGGEHVPPGYHRQMGQYDQYGHTHGQSPEHIQAYSPGVGMTNQDRPGGPLQKDNGSRWGEGSLRRFPEDYPSQVKGAYQQNAQQYCMGRGDAHSPHSGMYQELSGTIGSTNNARAFMQRKESEVEQAFGDGYQRGYKLGYQAAYTSLVQQMSMQSFHSPDRYPSREMGPMRQFPSHPPMGAQSLSPNVPNYGRGPPMNGYASTSDLDHIQPAKSNKTDDAKITNTGELKETNSQEKSLSALQTREISLKEMRHQKEPQQSTEPM